MIRLMVPAAESPLFGAAAWSGRAAKSSVFNKIADDDEGLGTFALYRSPGHMVRPNIGAMFKIRVV